MNAAEKIRLWQVTKLRDLTVDSELVQNQSSGRLMVRRAMPAESIDLMRKMTKIRHRNLMAVYDCDLIDGKCVCLCEYIDGETLESRVEHSGVLDEPQTRRVMSDICDALSAIHAAGIIHRDVTASNVMLTDDGTVKLIDYDIARTFKKSAATDTQILGTVGYASPEQFGFSQTDARADVYSCGVLMNYLLTGAMPNERRCDGALGKVIGYCIEIDEEKRYASAAELKQAFSGKKLRSPDELHARYRPLPGFRSKRLFPKLLTASAITLYGLLAAVYIRFMADYLSEARSTGWTTSLSASVRNKSLTALVFLVLLTLIPYLCFGDVGRLSRKLSPKNYARGEWIMKALGWLSIIGGIAIMLFVEL